MGRTDGSATGVGDAGTRYVIRYHRTDNNHFVFDSRAGRATTVETYRVTSLGGGENFQMRAVLRLILNPDFTRTVLVNHTTVTCTG